MSLIRCVHLLSRKNGPFLNVLKHSIVHSSSNENSSGRKTKQENGVNNNDDKKETNRLKSETKTVPAARKARMKELLTSLSSRSALSSVREVQTSKPLGYTKIRQKQQVDGQPCPPQNVWTAAKAVAEALGDERIEQEILAPIEQQRDHGVEFLDDVISKMKGRDERPKVGSYKQTENGEFSRYRTPTFIKEANREKQPKSQSQHIYTVVHIFNGEAIGVFSISDNLNIVEDGLKTWKKLAQYDLNQKISLAPRNYYEKMAHWTEQGKVWHFPIDNEQGLDEENETSFTEHVFLEDHLEPWCPRKGAVRNFMELVCIGLSKNPYLSVHQKREHIEWYRNYFHEKRDILKRVIEANNRTTEIVKITNAAKTTQVFP